MTNQSQRTKHEKKANREAEEAEEDQEVAEEVVDVDVAEAGAFKPEQIL